MLRPPIKGPVRATRNAFIVSRSIAYLSRGAEEALFDSIEVLSEGAARVSASGERRYFGSTMITIDLDRLRRHWRGALDAAQLEQLCELMKTSVRVRLRVARIACEEAARRVTERPLGTAQVETQMRLTERTLHIDVDLELAVGVSSSARRAP